MTYETIVYEKRDRVAVVTLNLPAKLGEQRNRGLLYELVFGVGASRHLRT